MVSTTNIKYLLFLAIPTLWASCLKQKEFPTTPAITYNNFTKYINAQGNDSAAVLSISYTDGDGDIGLSQGDTVAPYTGTYYYNCFLEYYEKQNGVWIKPNIPVPFYYRIPPLLQDGQKAVEGDINVYLPYPYFSPVSPYDTIKFSIKIADRQLHESNVVETPEIVVVK